MRLGSSSLMLRSLLTTALFALIGVLLTAAAASSLVSRFWAVTAVRDPPREVMRAARACHQGLVGGGSLTIGPRHFAFYNPASFTPIDPAQPGLPDELVHALRTVPGLYIHTGLPIGDGTIAASVKRGGSRCGVLVVRIAESPLHRRQVQMIILGTAGVVALLAGLGAYLLAARPLLRRVAAASATASKVGAADFALPAQRGWEDLALIFNALAGADRRIKANEALLHARAAEIESLLGSVAHDLKTPLAVIQVNLQRAASAASPEEQRASHSKALAEVQYAATLLENLETGVQLRAGVAAPAGAQCDLADIVSQTVTRFEVLGAHVGVEVAGAWPDAELTVQADATLCMRVLANLVHNALRHSRGRHVAIMLSVAGTEFVVVVRDDGVGFSDAQLAHHSAVASAAALKAGARRGLGIVRALCAQQGFAVVFANAAEGGACVTISGPIHSA